jgi:hypothetical protein
MILDSEKECYFLSFARWKRALRLVSSLGPGGELWISGTTTGGEAVGFALVGLGFLTRACLGARAGRASWGSFQPVRVSRASTRILQKARLYDEIQLACALPPSSLSP